VQENTQTKYNSKKQTIQNTAKQNYPGSVAYDTRPGNEMGLFYSASEPIRRPTGQMSLAKTMFATITL